MHQADDVDATGGGATELGPGPAPGSPYTKLSLAELRLAVAAAEAADSARRMVPTGTPQPGHYTPGVRLADALRMLNQAQRVVDAAVIVELEHHRTVEDLTTTAAEEGAPVSDPRHWAELEQRWTGWTTALRHAHATGSAIPNDVPEELQDPDTMLARLDQWAVRHREPGDLHDGARPVSDRMQRMDTFTEMMQLSTERGRLLDHHLAPPAELLLPLYEREAELAERMAHAGYSDYAEHAARRRAQATELRSE